MTDPTPKSAIILARVAVALLLGLVVTGVVRYGVSAEVLQRFWENIVARPGGPMTFRFVLQPMMAGIVALRHAVNDARLGRLPYLSAIVRGVGGRGSLLWEGVVATARILILGVAMDLVYQSVFFGTFHPAESALIAILLAFVPYVLLRGSITRVAHHSIARPVADEVK